MPYENRDPKLDHNIDNHPYGDNGGLGDLGLRVWGLGGLGDLGDLGLRV